MPHAGGPAGGQPPRRKRRTALIASVTLAVLLLLCGGGATAAFFLLRDSGSGTGAANPTEAVEGFLQAVYQDRDAAKATALVCSQARDAEAVTRKVQEVEQYAQTYENPRFTWSTPSVDEQDEERAVVSVDVTMTTADEKTAEQPLTFTVVQTTGWWVCEVG